ncbi:MAG: M20/M25/M40 family metallo-hydrolase [Bdellovibrionales bacterium]|nr:M20/M25/M40 family metallo-hydrolase [Bdellovibrionales bacterium]
MRRFTDEARDLIRIPSVSLDGNEEAANWAAGLLRERGFKVNIKQVMHSHPRISQRQFNVIGVLGNPLVERKIRKGLLLVSHLDTADPGHAAAWTECGGDPYKFETREDAFYGLGTANAKIDFLCRLHAAQRFRERKLKEPVYVVGTSGAEIGMLGVRYLIQSLAVNPRWVLVSAPTDLDVIHAHKSAHLFKVSVRYHVVDRDAKGFNRRVNLHAFGRSGPSAVPDDSANALSQILKFIERANESGFETRHTLLSGGALLNQIPDRASAEFYLTSHQFEDFKRFFRDITSGEPEAPARFEIELGGLGDMGIGFLPEVLFESLLALAAFVKELAVGMADRKDEAYEVPNATTSLSTVRQSPNLTELYFDVRMLPGTSEKVLLERVRLGIGKLAAKYPGLNVSVDLESSSPELDLPADHPWVKTCAETLEAAGVVSKTRKSSLSTEAGYFSRKTYDVACFGPGGLGGGVYGPNEHVRLEDIQKATLFYEQLIERTCM